MASILAYMDSGSRGNFEASIKISRNIFSITSTTGRGEDPMVIENLTKEVGGSKAASFIHQLARISCVLGALTASSRRHSLAKSKHPLVKVHGCLGCSLAELIQMHGL